MFVSKKILIIGISIIVLFISIGIGLKLEKIQSPLLAMPAATDFFVQNEAPRGEAARYLRNSSELPTPLRQGFAGLSLSSFSQQAAGYSAKENKTVQEINKASGQIKSEDGAVKVVRVIDGDTIEMEGGERVRYIGIDTPETLDPRKPVQCFGVEASNKNKELVEGKMARLEKDITDRDKYNRLLRYVWVDGAFINYELVKQGFAYSYSYPPDVKYQDQFIKAQQEARELKRGLWNSCPAQNQTAIPSVASAQTETSVYSEENLNGSCLIKGNISSSGEKIYHLPGCGSYTKTKIDEARGEKWFCAESEALAAGWRKANNCQQ